MTTTTALKLINTTAQHLHDSGVAFGHGTAEAFDEAAWMVLWRLGMPLESGPTELAERQVSADELAAVEALVTQRITSRKPAAYLMQEAWLQGIPFYIDERAIVPRSFIAELIADESIDPWLGESTRSVLDLCTGNGSLAVIAAMAWPEVQVDACDISADALAVAHINVDKHALQERIRLFESDGLAAIDRMAAGPYDLILCNPPYVNAASMAALPAEYQAEPALALAGGADGMDLVRKILRDAPAHLAPQGVLVLEIGNERANFEAAFPGLEVVWLDTSAGEDQVLLVTRAQLTAVRGH